MHVDKFGRISDTDYSGINIANIANSFIRIDGGNNEI